MSTLESFFPGRTSIAVEGGRANQSRVNCVPIRICSPRKTNVARGRLDELYDAPMLKAYFTAFKDFRWGFFILSRKLGLCHSSRTYDNYGDADEKTDAQILRLLRAQRKILLRTKPEMAARLILVYWNHRPLTHDKWVGLLRDAGFRVVEARTIAAVKAICETGVLP